MESFLMLLGEMFPLFRINKKSAVRNSQGIPVVALSSLSISCEPSFKTPARA